MTAPDIAELVGYLITAYAIGFAGGWQMAIFRNMTNRVV